MRAPRHAKLGAHEHSPSPYNYQTPPSGIWFGKKWPPWNAARLDAQLFQQRFQVGLVDGDLGGRLAIQRGLDGPFIEGLE